MEWKDIPGYEGLYAVSDTGDVYSYKRHRLLRPKIDRYGYLQITLSKAGKHQTTTVHRLVAKAFIPNLHGKATVNHIDENKLNNTVSNLEWATARENINHGTRNIRMSLSKQTKPVKMLSLGGESVAIFTGIKEAMKVTGVNRNSIRDVLKGNRPSAGGYRWEYANEMDR